MTIQPPLGLRSTDELIKIAMAEDLPQGDVTTESLGLTPRQGRARLIAKQDLVLSGAPVFEQAIHYLEPSAKMKWHFEEGEAILNRQIVCTVYGDLVQILKAERVALNFMMHMSGIATTTRQYVTKLAGSKTKLLDTRKTTPGLRALEKRAVVHGGGVNHRMNLSSAILIKNNHISVMGGITAAIERVRSLCDQPIEVEARNIEEVRECIELKVQRILLDNMKNEEMIEALLIIPENIETEASGNMNLERVASIANLGLSFISVGALTHSAPSADLSLTFDWDET